MERKTAKKENAQANAQANGRKAGQTADGQKAKRPSKAADAARALTEKKFSGSILAVRIRGNRSSVTRIEQTMLLLNLSRKYHATIIPAGPIDIGMVNHAKDYITFGSPSEQTVEALLRKAGKTADGKPITDDYLKSKTAFGSIKELAAAVTSGKERLSRIKAVKAVFRLNPPRKGIGSIKAAYPRGALGPRDTKAIEELVTAMM